SGGARRTRLSAFRPVGRPVAVPPDKPALRADVDHRHHQSRLRRMVLGVRRRRDDHRLARSPHASLRHRRDRQRKLALQEPRLSCPAPTGFRDVTIGSGPVPRKPIGEKAMTDAERQARYRAARAADAPVIRTRRLADHRSRARRWQDAVTQLTELQAQYADWLEALPANQHDSALAEALQAICELDLSELESVAPPRGFGRD